MLRPFQMTISSFDTLFEFSEQNELGKIHVRLYDFVTHKNKIALETRKQNCFRKRDETFLI